MPEKKYDRVGEENLNNEGYSMKIINYFDANNIVVEFQDKNHYTTNAAYSNFKKGTIKNWGAKIGEEIYNNQNLKMTIIAYRRSDDIDVQFEDGYVATNKTYSNFKRGNIRNNNIQSDKLGKENVNFQGCVMKVVKYNKYRDIVVEFQDKFKSQVHSTYHLFKTGYIKNPYHPTVCGVGISGNKYPITENNRPTKEYDAWHGMLRRCYDEKTYIKHPTYKNTSVCEGWLLYDNFYEWLHNQENFEQWLNGERWALDKDILVKGNKIYSPETCCLVPDYVNSILTKSNINRGELPIGVSRTSYNDWLYEVNCNKKYIIMSDNIVSAFNIYKRHKEEAIKKTAQEEYDKGNITKRCYEALINYEVEITD